MINEFHQYRLQNIVYLHHLMINSLELGIRIQDNQYQQWKGIQEKSLTLNLNMILWHLVEQTKL
jgi:hypothetical protein